MFQRASRSVALCGLALCFVGACGGDGGEGAVERPSVTGSLSSTPSLPSPTRSASLPERTNSESATPEPSRSSVLSPDTTRTSAPEPERTSAEPERTSAEPTPRPPDGTSTVLVLPGPTPGTPSTSPSPTPPTEEEAGQTSSENSGSTAGWLALALLATAVVTWLIVRVRRRHSWSTTLAATEADLAWFARSLVPQLRSAGSVDRVAGGWQVARPRVASAEDQLTVLESSARGDPNAARARRLRDAVRSARQRMDLLSGPGDHEEWALDLDDVSTLLEVALGPPVDSAAAR